MSRLVLPDSAKPDTSPAKLTISWGNDGANVVLVVQSGVVVTQVLMPPQLAVQLSEGLAGSAKQVLDLQRKATEPTMVN